MAAGQKIVESNQRKALFLEMAARPEGATVADVYQRAASQGETVTEEAYHNLARRLVHRGLITVEIGAAGKLYRTAVPPDAQWLEEDALSALVDHEYPLQALPIWKESRRQLNEVPESVWVELRERLRTQEARPLFRDAVVSYCENLHAQVADLCDQPTLNKTELGKLRQEAENSRRQLHNMAKYGLGLSEEAVMVPLSLDVAIDDYRKNGRGAYYDLALLEEELRRRVAPGPFIVDIADPPARAQQFVIAAVDGSMRGGLLSFLGEDSDVEMGHSPMVAINTSVAHLNQLKMDRGEKTQVFLRLPETPEDMQRQDNRYTIMAKLLFPDLSEAQYMHSVWNAMDLIETKAAQRVLKRWYTSGGIEAPAADIVLRDGAIAPQDRDFNHYADISTYGKIVRDMIEVNWEIARKCRDDGQTLAGVVKAAQLSVFAPVVNWFACQVAAKGAGQLLSWPMHSLNLMADQALLTRLLTAGRGQDEPWTRTCAVMRPFHAVTNFGKTYTRKRPAAQTVLERHTKALAELDALDQEARIFWESFRGKHDPFVQMLENTHYAGFFLGAVPRLDVEKNLPRFEALVTAPTAEGSADPWPQALEHIDRLVLGLQQNGFDVSAEHSMFESTAKLDVLPRQIIMAHDTVKTWARELLSRVQEYIGYYLARYVNTKRFRGIKVRPFTKQELELLYDQLKSERHAQAGGSTAPQRHAQAGGGATPALPRPIDSEDEDDE